MTVLNYSGPYQSSCSISTDDEELIRAVKLKYGQYISENCPSVPADHHISIIKDQNGYQFATDSGTFSTQKPMYEIDRYLFIITDYDESVFAIHGAAVEWNRKAYLFLASTTSGKTTLVSYLTSLGFGYVTEDCILLDRKNLTVLPNTSPIQLRKGGLEVLKKYNAEPQGLERLDFGSAPRYVYTPDHCVRDAIPLEKIFFIKRSNDENRLVTMSYSEKVEALMKSPITVYSVTGEYVRFIARLAQSNCQGLIYRDMDYVAEVIQNG